MHPESILLIAVVDNSSTCIALQASEFGFRLQDFQSLGFRLQDFQSLGFRRQGLGFMHRGFRVVGLQSSGLSGSIGLQASGFALPGPGCKVDG